MKYVKQIGIILLICLIAEVLEYVIPLPVAAGIYGLILMLAALITGIVPLKKIENVADFLTGNLSIMFIPPTVGIMACVEEIKQMFLPLVVISVVSTLLIMAVTGWVSQGVLRHSRRKELSDTSGEQTGVAERTDRS